MATVIDLVKATMLRLQLPATSIAVGSTDPNVVQILAAMTAAADEIVARYPFNRLLPDGLWISKADGTGASSPGLDSDRVLIDAALMRSAVLWRWRSDQGFDYAEDFRATEERLARLGGAYTKEQRGGVLQT